jgi:hypothetical protein
MTIAVNIKVDLKKATRFLTQLQRKQIPFAASLAMNRTAQAIQKVEKSKIKTDLDNPTPQTVKSIRVKRSTKRDLTAAVFILPAISKFLKFQIEGGTRSPRGRTEAVPVGIRLNKFGNIIGRRQGKLKKTLARVDTFSATINGVAGIWQRGRGRRRNKEVKLLVAYENRVTYKPRFPFFRYAQRTLNRIWRAQFNQAMRQAMRGARR